MFSCFNRKISNIHPEGVICVICHEHVQEYYSCLNCSTKDNEPMENREGKICDPCLCKLRETHNNKCPLCRCEKINHRYGGDEYWHGNIIGKPEEELVSIDKVSKNITESIGDLIEKKLDSFSSTVNNK